MPMTDQPKSFMLQTDERARVELLLTTADGMPWTLTMSAGVERFIGRYPRLNRILVVDGPLLDYRTAYPGS